MRVLPLTVLSLALACSACGRVGYESQAAGDSGAEAGPRDSSLADSGSAEAGARDSAADGRADTGGATDSGTGDAGPCEETPCRLVAPQCGCATGLGCFENAGVRECSAAGAVAAGDTCVGPADCRPGSTCFHWGDRAYPGICRELCFGAADCPTSGDCADTSAGGTSSGLGGCTFDCDPVNDTGCPAPLTCYAFGVLSLTTGAPTLATVCATASGGAAGSACIRPRDCGPGTTCVSTGGPGACSALCVSDATCTGGTTCRELDPTTDIAGTPLGACL